MSWTKGQGVAAADQALASYQSQLRELESEHSSVTSDMGVVEAELRAAVLELTQLLMPDTSPRGLSQASTTLQAPWLVERRRELEQKRVEWARRLTQIEQDPQFARRQQLLAAGGGELLVRAATLGRQKQALEQELSTLDTETHQWLKNRELQKAVERGAFASFWDTLTLSDMRERRAQERWASEVGAASYEQAKARFESLSAQIQHTRLELDRAEHDRQRLLALLQEHGQLYSWTHDFETHLATTLRAQVAQMLRAHDLGPLHRALDESKRPLVARAHALGTKLEYLQNLQGFLKNQIEDRKARIGPIQKTRLTWSMKPGERISGNKVQWLVALPQAKAHSTHKQVRMARRVHHNVVEYEDYDDYSYYLYHHRAFLPWDAFAYGAEEPMPYEGFSRQIIPAIAEHRATHALERANLAEYKSLDRQAEREERALDRERLDEDPVRDEAGGDDSGVHAADADAEDLRDAEAGLSTEGDGGTAEDSS